MSSSSIAIKVICNAAFSTASLSSSTEDYKNPQTDSICNIRTVQTAGTTANMATIRSIAKNVQ